VGAVRQDGSTVDSSSDDSSESEDEEAEEERLLRPVKPQVENMEVDSVLDGTGLHLSGLAQARSAAPPVAEANPLPCTGSVRLGLAPAVTGTGVPGRAWYSPISPGPAVGRGVPWAPVSGYGSATATGPYGFPCGPTPWTGVFHGVAAEPCGTGVPGVSAVAPCWEAVAGRPVSTSTGDVFAGVSSSEVDWSDALAWLARVDPSVVSATADEDAPRPSVASIRTGILPAARIQSVGLDPRFIEWLDAIYSKQLMTKGQLPAASREVRARCRIPRGEYDRYGVVPSVTEDDRWVLGVQSAVPGHPGPALVDKSQVHQEEVLSLCDEGVRAAMSAVNHSRPGAVDGRIGKGASACDEIQEANGH
jgi:hypothetical protein